MYKPTYEKDKAVSPIIATILIVAITVVLAATLYAVIGGYGGLIGKSTPTAGVSVTSSTGKLTIQVNSVSGNLSLTDLKVQVTLSDGSTGSAALANGGSITAGSDTVAIAITGGSGYVTGLTTITLTTTPTSLTVSSFKVVDTSTSGTVVSWPS